MTGFRCFRHLSHAALLGGILAACAQIGLPVGNHTNTGYLDEVISGSPAKVRAELQTYLQSRNFLESLQTDNQGNFYLHQNWVQSPSLRYYLLDFDQRQRHLSEWKALWYIERGGGPTSKVRLAILELLYLGDPGDRVRAPKEADGNWVETDLDLERAKALMADFKEWRLKGKLPKPALFLTTEDLAGPPKSKLENRKRPAFAQPPWLIP